MNLSRNNTTIKKRISAEREKMGWTQLQLAQKAKITPAAVCQIEKGNRIPTILVLHRIAQALKVSLDYLAGYKDAVELSDVIKNKEIEVFFRKYNQLNKSDKDFIEKFVNLKIS